MHLRLSLAALLLLSCATAHRATPSAPPPPEGSVDPERIRRHVEVLAADAFEGRQPGTPGEEKTLRYLVEQMKEIGLAPAAADGYLQPVPLQTTTVEAGATLTAAAGDAREELRHTRELLFVGAGGEPEVQLKDLPLVFVGFGLHAPAAGRNDFGDADLRGKAVLMLFGAAPSDTQEAALRAAASLPAKVAEAKRRGASLVLMILPPMSERAWAAQVEEHGGGITQLETKAEGGAPLLAMVRVDAARRLLQLGGQELQPLLAAAQTGGSAPTPLPVKLSASVRTEVRRFRSHNVAGVLRGSAAPDEHILFLAHWDGVPDCSPDDEGDAVCNGAVDNASGVGALLELARAFSRAPAPRRSILFLATTAEESGLLGARHYAAQPLVPLAKTVGGMGMDTVAVRGRGAEVVLLGKGLSELDALVEAAALAQKRTVVEGGRIQAFFERSDHFALAEVGVPMVIATGVFAQNTDAAGLDSKATTAFMRQRYHQASDELTPETRFDGAAEDTELAYAVGKALADSTAWPAWREGTPFAEKRRQHPPPTSAR